MQDTTTARTPQQLADHLAITEVLHRYCRAMDRIDAELGYSVWHADGEADYGEIFRGSGRGFIDWVCAVHRSMLVTSHRLTNILIDLDGKRAGSESYVCATLRHMDGKRLLQTSAWGRYIDRWSQQGGRWAIERRLFLPEFNEVREVTAGASPAAGRTDRDDPSYQVLR